jgi:cysteine desulfurase
MSVSLPGYPGEVIMNYLDARGVYVSRSSACRKGKRSRVLEAMGLRPDVIDGAVRVSFSKFTTIEEIDYFVEALAGAKKELLKRL